MSGGRPQDDGYEVCHEGTVDCGKSVWHPRGRGFSTASHIRMTSTGLCGITKLHAETQRNGEGSRRAAAVLSVPLRLCVKRPLQLRLRQMRTRTPSSAFTWLAVPSLTL